MASAKPGQLGVGVTVQQRKQIAGWIGWKNVNLNLLYKASRDGCSYQAFRERCNNKGPTITLLHNTTGYSFGMYASQSWASLNTWTNDPNAFLFRLCENHHFKPLRIKAGTTGYTALYNYTNYGPGLGNSYHGHHEFYLMAGTTHKFENNGDGRKVVKPDIVLQPNNNCPTYPTLQWNGVKANDLTGGNHVLFDVEVYAVTESDLLEATDVWRRFSYPWSTKTLDDLKKEIATYAPLECLHMPQARVLMTGAVGAGKSSFFNTINSVFKGYVTGQAPAGSASHSLTTKYRTYEIRQKSGGDGLNVKLCDTMGVEEKDGINISDFIYILDGNIPHGYQFSPVTGITPDTPRFKKAPKLADRIHVVAFVVDASSAGVMKEGIRDKIRAIKALAVQRAVPQVVLLTNIDKVCPYVDDDVSMVFRSSDVQAAVANIADVIGLPRSHVLPVKNYEDELELDSAVSILALIALRQILRLADGFFDEQYDLLCGEN